MMNLEKLADILHDMYSNAPTGYKVSNIHFFGVKYAAIILRNKYSIKDIVLTAGLNESYATEVSKGVKLSRYVIPK